MVELTKKQQAEVELIKKHILLFCKVNNINVPTLVLTDDFKHKDTVGYYKKESNRITLIVNRCNKLAKDVSSPYTKDDDTVLGTAIHEFGHYIHEKKGWSDFSGFTKRAINSYARSNFKEDFAESFRLFVLNPDYLIKKDNERYNAFIKMGFKPIKKITCDKLLDKYKIDQTLKQKTMKDLNVKTVKNDN